MVLNHQCNDGYQKFQWQTEAEETKEMLDDMHKRKIDMADGIFVVNIGGYIGDSTKSEIKYAMEHGKR